MARTAFVQTASATATVRVQAFVSAYVPTFPEARAQSVGLAAWLHQAALLRATAPLGTVTRAAWGTQVPPGALSNRFRGAGLSPPGRYADAVRLAVLCHAVNAGLTLAEFARGADPRPLYRLCRAVAAPYYCSARIVLETARRLDATWAAERWLAPLLLAVPADAWAARHLLVTLVPRRTS